VDTVSDERITPNQCTRIAKRRLIETGWACGGTLALQVVLPARNRVISSVGRLAFSCTKEIILSG